MTNMIYRGAKQTGQGDTKVCTARELIYRGVAHDRMSAASEAHPSSAVMYLRGVCYVFPPIGATRRVHPAASRGGTRGAVMRLV